MLRFLVEFKLYRPRRGLISSNFRNVGGAAFPQSYRVRTHRLHMYKKYRPRDANIQDLTKRNTKKRRNKLEA
jgi:hypothetical protein